MRKLEAAFPDGDYPAISVFEVGGAYFVSDGHHRVALAHQRGQEFIEAEVVHLATNYRLSPDVDIPQLVHTELRRMVMEESGLQLVRPDLDISFSNPAGYLELLETIKAHGWDLARCLGRLPSPEELGMSWLAEVYQPGLRALHEAGLSCPHEDATEADSFLWLYQRRRALWMRALGLPIAMLCTTFVTRASCRDGSVARYDRQRLDSRRCRLRSWSPPEAPSCYRLRSRPGEGLRLTAWLPFPADGRRPCSNSI